MRTRTNIIITTNKMNKVKLSIMRDVLDVVTEVDVRGMVCVVDVVIEVDVVIDG